MRLVTAAASTAGPVSMPSSLSLSWPEPSSSLFALSGFLQAKEPLSLVTDPCHSLPCYKGCKAYEDGWSKRDERGAHFSLLQAQTEPGLMATKEQQSGSSVGIEKLVDELCAKLKQIQQSEAEAPQSPRPNFALVLQDMHDAHYSDFPSLGAECRSTDFADAWSEDYHINCDDHPRLGNSSWLSGNTNELSSLAKELRHRAPYSNTGVGQADHDQYLHVLAENHHNALTSLMDVNNDPDIDLDLILDAIRPSSGRGEDHSLARLIAKFDSTVEALWSPDSAVLEDKSPQIEAQTFISSGTNLTSSIWSDTGLNESSHLVEADKAVGDKRKCIEIKSSALEFDGGENDSKDVEVTETIETSWQINYGLGILSQQILDGENELQQNSLNILNHHREKSGFTEVRKSSKAAKSSWINEVSLKVSTAEKPSGEVNQEEEDLLTSARTHFRPIKQSSMEQGIASSQEVVQYEDGTTFAISSSLDKPPFTRSASGTLYLQAADSPKKYMLFTEKEPYNGRYLNGEFVPKFAVKKTEKGVQTEVDSEESDCEEDKGFYFPEDEDQFADNIDCPADIEDEGEESSSGETSDEQESQNEENEVEYLRAAKQRALWGPQLPSNVPTWRDAKWCGGEGLLVNAGGDLNQHAPWFSRLWLEGGSGDELMSALAGSSSEYTASSARRLREELTAEGEQLFADIQYLQTLFLGDCWQAGELGQRGEDEEDSDAPPENNTKGGSSNPQGGFTALGHDERTYDDFAVAPRIPASRYDGLQSLPGWEAAVLPVTKPQKKGA